MKNTFHHLHRGARLAVAAACFALCLSASLASAETRQSNVGMPVRIDGLVIDGPELEAVPWTDRKTPVAVQIVNVYPHGTAFRYDIEYYGLEPGEYDLRNYLKRKDGSSIENVAAIPVTVISTLPAGQIVPRDLQTERTPGIGGYRALAIALGVMWVVGLVLLLWKRRKPVVDTAPKAKAETLADRLQPIVEAAVQGKLEPAQRAELERLLLSYWRHRLDLDDVPAPQAIARLRQHPEAGELLRQLESWLHRPDPPEQVNVAALLAPYRNLPAEAASSATHDSRGPVTQRTLVESHTTT